jgi:hypothetical protein
MHRVLLADIADGDPRTPFVHGATVVIDKKRLLLTGEKGSGKSTLSLYLALRGHIVEGDEHLLIRQHGVIARPRTLRVKEGTLSFVPDVPLWVYTAPYIRAWDGGLIRSVDPRLLVGQWSIAEGRLDGLVFLTANHGGRSVAKAIQPEMAFSRLMREIVLPLQGVGAAAARLRQLCLSTPAFELILGDLATAEWHLVHTAKDLT